jgi:multidrug efflux pump subunit AcrA (membrane-fusion protein)
MKNTTKMGTVSIFAACLIVCGCSKKKEAEEEAPAPVQVAAVTQDNVRRTITGDGTLFPLNQWNVVPKVTAPVQKFLVNRGDQVKEGQLLAVLENRDLAATVAANRGQLEQANANLTSTQDAAVPEAVVKAQTDVESDQEQYDAARRVLESRQKLFKDGALARKSVDDAAVALASAKAQLETAKEHLRALQAAGKEAQIKAAAAAVTAARGQLQTSEAQLNYSEVRSPGSGVVADRPLYAGDIAQAGTPLLVVMDTSRVVARINLPTRDASTVRIGQPATIALGETGKEVEGKVTVVSPATDPNSATVQVWVQADNPDRSLKPGTSAHVSIVTETIKNAMLVPVAAILPGETGGTAVLVVSGGIAHRRAVQLGVRQGDRVQVLTGVAPREDVVVVGGMGVDDKGKVKVVEATAPEAEEDQPEAATPEKGEKKDEGKPKQK